MSTPSALTEAELDARAAEVAAEGGPLPLAAVTAIRVNLVPYLPKQPVKTRRGGRRPRAA